MSEKKTVKEKEIKPEVEKTESVEFTGKYIKADELNKFSYDLPWSRMFEVEVKQVKK